MGDRVNATVFLSIGVILACELLRATPVHQMPKPLRCIQAVQPQSAG